ncbi:MAG: hypothetical protein U0V70_10125 [Terriglobia bacterium]
MIEYWNGFVSLVITSGLAWLGIDILDRHRLLTPLEKTPLSFLLGLGVVAWEMLNLQLGGQSFSLRWILIPLFGMMIPLWVGFKAPQPPKGVVQTRGRRTTDRWSVAEILLLVGIFGEIGFALTRALLLPMEDFDAVGNWGLKSKAIYLANGIPLGFFGNDNYRTAHPDYPLLLPLAESYVYYFLGHWNDFVAKWIFPLSLIACAASLFTTLRRIKLDRKTALVFVFLLVSIPHFGFQATNGYADILIAAYFGAAFFYLFLWIRRKESIFLWLSALLSAMAGLTKNEGTVVCLVNGIILVLALAADRSCSPSRRWRPFLIYTGILLGVLFPWLVFRFSFDTSNDLINQKNLANLFQWNAFVRIKTILYYYQSHVFNVKNWNLLWLLAIALYLTRVRRIMRSDQRFILIALGMTFVLYTGAYFVTSYDVAWHLRTSVSRLLVHFVPLLVFGFACAYQEESAALKPAATNCAPPA